MAAVAFFLADVVAVVAGGVVCRWRVSGVKVTVSGVQVAVGLEYYHGM